MKKSLLAIFTLAAILFYTHTVKASDRIRPFTGGFGLKYTMVSVTEDMGNYIEGKYTDDDEDLTEVYEGLTATVFLDFFPIKYLEIYTFAEGTATINSREDSKEGYDYPGLFYWSVGALPGICVWFESTSAFSINFGPTYSWYSFAKYNAKGKGGRFRMAILTKADRNWIRAFMDIDGTVAEDKDNNNFEIGGLSISFGIEGIF